MRISKLFLFLTILLAPLYVVRFNVGSYPSTLLEILVGLTVVAWIFEKIWSKSFDLRFTISDLPVALFFSAAVVSVVVSPDKRGALGVLKAYFVEPLLIYFVIKDTIRSKKDWRLLFLSLALSGLWVALLAILQGLTGWATFAPWESSQGRAHAVYNTANAVGLYLGPIIFLVLGTVKEFKVFRVFGIVLMILATILSKSAGAVVGLVGGLGIFGPEPRWVQGKGKLLIGLATLVGILFFFNISTFTPNVNDPYVRETNNTLQFRLCLWEGARDLLLDKPIFGAGLSGFKELYAEKYFTCDAEPLEYPHNWILNFWTEMGVLGLVGFLLLLVMYFRNVGSHLSDKRTRWLALGFAAAMVYWLIHGLVDVPYFKNDLSLEFFVLVGLAETLGFAF